MLSIFLLVPLIQFLITPIAIKFNFYTYYSRMVVSMGKSTRYIDLHNGSSFDYLLEMNKVRPGLEWKKKMLFHYLSALNHIIQKIESQQIPKQSVIRGSSYFISSRTAEKLGFSVKKTSAVETLNIVLNYVDLVWMHSLSNGYITFPNLTNIKTISIEGSDLIKHKSLIEKSLYKLNASQN